MLARRQELEALAETAEAAADVVTLDQSKVGRLSRMDAMQAQAMAQDTMRRRDGELKAIAAALQRIDNDVYGLCEQCEEPIAAARLKADPTARYCIACASKRET